MKGDQMQVSKAISIIKQAKKGGGLVKLIFVPIKIDEIDSLGWCDYVKQIDRKPFLPNHIIFHNDRILEIKLAGLVTHENISILVPINMLINIEIIKSDKEV